MQTSCRTRQIHVFFRAMQAIHLFKDVGMLPILLQKNHDYKATFVSEHHIETPQDIALFKDATFISVPKITSNHYVNEFIYVYKNRKNIDVLFTINNDLRYMMLAFFFKLVRGKKKGVSYLKLDANKEATHKKFYSGIKGNIYKIFRKQVDIMSVEASQLQSILSKNWNKKLALIPNGFYNWTNNFENSDITKESVILYSGRIGIWEKDHETLLAGFATIYTNHPQWKLMMVGPVEASFQPTIDRYFNDYPGLNRQIVFTGNIADRSILTEYYNQAAIFVLSSKSEGFPLVFPEAIASGCYIVSSDLAAAHDIVNNVNTGKIFPIGDVDRLADALNESIALIEEQKINFQSIRDYAIANFHWNRIVEKLNNLIVHKEIEKGICSR